MPRRKRKGRAVRKNRSKAEQDRADEEAKAPHSFVLHRGSRPELHKIDFQK